MEEEIEDEEELSSEEQYNRREKQIAHEMNYPEVRLGDKVITSSGLKGRLQGFNFDETVQVRLNNGQLINVDFTTLKKDIK